jgi:short-chain fatty acids transporter
MEHQTWLTRIALRCCEWSERWFPDAYVFAALGVIVVGGAYRIAWELW